MTSPQEDAELRAALLDISGISHNSLNDTIEIFSITKLTRFIKARDEQRELEAEIRQAVAIRVAYEQYSHDATPFYRTLCSAIDSKQERLAILTNPQEQDKEEE